MNEFFTNILTLVSTIDPTLRTILAAIAILFETSILIGLLVPGDTIVFAASTAVSSPAEFWALVVAVIIGALIGESIGFALGRFFGEKIRMSALGRKIGETNWQKAEQYVKKRGGIAVFVSRFLPVFHSLIPVTVGMSHMSYRKFISWTLPASLLWTLLYVTVGSRAAQSYQDLSHNVHLAGFVLISVIIAFFGGVFLLKKWVFARERHHMDSSLEDEAEH